MLSLSLLLSIIFCRLVDQDKNVWGKMLDQMDSWGCLWLKWDQ